MVIADDRYREGWLKRLVNRLIVSFLKFLSSFPFWALYLLSNGIYFVVRYLFRYRVRVVQDNLRHAFPEKERDEIRKILNGFYRHFADLMLESIKLHHVSEGELNRHVAFKGLALVDEYFRQGRSIIVLAMHYNNWEWGSFTQTKVKHKALMLYNPVRGNQAMEDFLLHSRERWGGSCIPVHQSARVVLDFHRKGIPAVLWLAADQTPPANSKFWTTFLNREAPFFSGPEKIAARTNLPVFFMEVNKVGRGKYEICYQPLIENPREVDSNEILLSYVRRMEMIIRNKPEFYLWSHRRWKHKRPEDIPLTV